MLRRHHWAAAAAVLLVVIGGLVLVWRAAETGPVVRTVALGSVPTLIAVDAPMHRVFIGNSADSTVSVLDSDDGSVLGTLALGSPPADTLAGLAVDTRSGHAFAATSTDPGAEGRVVMLDARSGAVLHRVPVGHNPEGIAVDERTGRAFVYNCTDGTVSVVDTRTGALLVTRQVGPPGSGTFQVGTPVVVDERLGRVFVMHMDELFMLDARTGARRAALRLPDSGLNLALDRRTRRLFVMAADGTLSVLDARSGRLLRAVKMGVGTLATDARTGQVFLARSPIGSSPPFSGPQRLVMLDGHSGAVVRSVALGSPSYALAVDPRADRLLVATMGSADGTGRPQGYGSVEVRDSRTLALRGRIPVGVMPSAIALAEQRGLAFVVNSGAHLESGQPVRVPVPEDVGARLARTVKSVARWLPLAPPQRALSPPTGSVTLLNLARL
jgi:DNA-binding beta-propeller fold protein YncE